jgi:predicted MFS family arabinose efflux permease
MIGCILVGLGAVVRALVVTTEPVFGRLTTVSIVWSALSFGSAAGALVGGLVLDFAGYEWFGAVIIGASTVAGVSVLYPSFRYRSPRELGEDEAIPGV